MVEVLPISETQGDVLKKQAESKVKRKFGILMMGFGTSVMKMENAPLMGGKQINSRGHPFGDVMHKSGPKSGQREEGIDVRS